MYSSKSKCLFLALAFAMPLAPGLALADAPCNGHVDLCDRPYNEVVYATTHNAFNYFWGESQYYFVNQRFDITTQLNDGIRGLMIDIHEYNGFDSGHSGEIWTCHSFCWLGGQPLVDVLSEIRVFMDENPNEVITLIFESYVGRPEIEGAFEAAGLLEYAHSQDLDDAWPTLAEMIENDKRLVVLTDKAGSVNDWYMDVWSYAVETHYSAQSPSDLTCDYNRGDARNDLFILNHFLTYPLARRSLAYQVNYNPYLYERALSCQNSKGKIPNFVTVDFYSIGDTLEAVDQLNGL